jgi:hypothetical protein
MSSELYASNVQLPERHEAATSDKDKFVAECPIGQRLFSKFVSWALLLQSVS